MKNKDYPSVIFREEDGEKFVHVGSGQYRTYWALKNNSINSIPFNSFENRQSEFKYIYKEREEPVIPKLKKYDWEFHCSVDENRNGNGSIISNKGNYCIAKQPRYAEDGMWITHAKAVSTVPEMLKFLIEEWYVLVEDSGGRDKERIEEIEKMLIKAGAFDEDLY